MAMQGHDGKGCILADEMCVHIHIFSGHDYADFGGRGMGKTLQTITLVWTLLSSCNPCDPRCSAHSVHRTEPLREHWAGCRQGDDRLPSITHQCKSSRTHPDPLLIERCAELEERVPQMVWIISVSILCRCNINSTSEQAWP